jgi:hypothetical protein
MPASGANHRSGCIRIREAHAAASPRCESDRLRRQAGEGRRPERPVRPLPGCRGQADEVSGEAGRRLSRIALRPGLARRRAGHGDAGRGDRAVQGRNVLEEQDAQWRLLAPRRRRRLAVVHSNLETEVWMSLLDIISGIASGPGLQDAAEKAGVDPETAQGLLQGVLEHVQGGGGLDDAAGAIAAKTGIDPSQVQQFLPQIANLLQGHADNAGEGGGGLLGGLLGAFRR